jgi:transcription antitermination factor NusG
MRSTVNATQEPAFTLAESADVDRWFLVHTKSRHEKSIAEELAAKGIEHFLPLATTWRYYGRRKCKSEVPLFPGYLFAFGKTESAYEVDRSEHVASVLRVVDQDQLARDLAPIREAIARNAPLRPYVPIALGAEVEVRSGPFRGIRGRVDQDATAGRLVLHVDLIGRAAVLEIERSLLEPVT